MAESKKLSEKVALITGATTGIGKATAILFAKLGAKLAIVGRNKDGLEDTAKSCEQESNQKPLVLVVEDLRRDEDVQMVMDKTLEHYKRLDVLVNNAGSGSVSSIEKTTMAEFDETMSINVRSVYHLTIMAVPHLIKSKGVIVNVSSIGASKGFKNFVSYCTSKGAIAQFTRCVALDLADKGVRCNAVAPGTVASTFHHRMWGEERATQYYEDASGTHPLGRACTPEEVADAIAFLASDQSSFITGASIPIDGGRSVMCPSTIS